MNARMSRFADSQKWSFDYKIYTWSVGSADLPRAIPNDPRLRFSWSLRRRRYDLWLRRIWFCRNRDLL
jgi:hypothetical protein